MPRRSGEKLGVAGRKGGGMTYDRNVRKERATRMKSVDLALGRSLRYGTHHRAMVSAIAPAAGWQLRRCIEGKRRRNQRIAEEQY